jgi:predicted Zn-dependent peptidase
VTIQAFVKGGVLSDSPETSGRASLATQLMAKGTGKYSAVEIAEFFDTVGGSFATDSQRSSSFLQCSVLKEDFPKSLDFAYEVLFHPTFPNDEFAKLKELQLARIAARTAEPRAEILDFWSKLLPSSSPYSRTVLGDEKTVSALTVEQCQEFHANYFVPENMVLAVFGDIDLEATLGMIERSFGRVPRKGFKPFDFPREHPGTSKAVTKHLDNQRPNTAMVIVGYPTVSVYDHQTRSALEMFNAILTGGSGAGGRMFEELRGERLVYYVFGTEITGLAPGYFVFMAQTRPETAGEVVDRIQAHVERIRTEGIPQDEFERTRQKLIAAHAMSNTTPSSQAFQAAIDELYGFGFDHDKSYEDRIKKVTVEDVRKLVERFFQDPISATSSPAPTSSGAQ